MFEQKTILVTGGTGSFGNAFASLLLEKHDPARIIIYSRDEKKQHDMRIAFNDERLAFFIGDVRDKDKICSAMRGVDYVFHAAALKQVPSCEFFPMEAIQTNVIGANNVLDAAEQNDVLKLVVLSTDKAVYPINAMGQTKALMEKLMVARAKMSQTTVTFCGVRYGNVMYSRGSVIPLFVNQIKNSLPITVTHPGMTRLLLPLSQAVDLVTFAMEHGAPGDIFVRKAPAATVGDLAQATKNLFLSDVDVQIVGVREGEKMHEVLVTSEELVRAEEFDDYYRVSCHRDQDYDEYFSHGVTRAGFINEGYTSRNAKRLSVTETEQLLLRLPEVRDELAAWTGTSLTRKKSA